MFPFLGDNYLFLEDSLFATFFFSPDRGAVSRMKESLQEVTGATGGKASTVRNFWSFFRQSRGVLALEDIKGQACSKYFLWFYDVLCHGGFLLYCFKHVFFGFLEWKANQGLFALGVLSTAMELPEHVSSLDQVYRRQRFPELWTASTESTHLPWL